MVGAVRNRSEFFGIEEGGFYSLLLAGTMPLTPLLNKEGQGEVFINLFYPTLPPLVKGRRKI